MSCLKLTYRTDYTALKAVQSGLYVSGKTGAGSYRFGFNGMEKDNEMKGVGNSLDFGARIYDSRLGKWLSIDPFFKSYPSHSPYSFGLNNPIYFIDKDGKYIVDKDGNVIKFTVNKKGQVKIKSKNIDPFTEKYILSMAKTPTSSKILIQLRDDKDIRLEVKKMTPQENEILRKGENGEFKSISGTVMSKDKYNNLNEYVNGSIDKEKYISNERRLNVDGLMEMNSPDQTKTTYQKLPEQYSNQVILINEDPINESENPDKEFFKTSLEESYHATQDYIEVKTGGIQSQEDYENLRHEKEAKEVVEKAVGEYDKQ
jgi:RHS repeat-associated protein